MSSARIRVTCWVTALLLSACQVAPVQETVISEPEPEPQPEQQVVLPSCECPTVEPLACPTVEPPPPVVSAPCPVVKVTATPGTGLLLIGRVENIFLKRNGSANKTLKIKARIDTGAGLSSMHAEELVDFERDGKPWVRFAVLEPKTKKKIYFERPVTRFVTIKQLSGEHQRRPIVSMSLVLGDIEENVEVTLTDRSDYVYQILIGRNFLRDRAVVDVSHKFIAKDMLHVN